MKTLQAIIVPNESEDIFADFNPIEFEDNLYEGSDTLKDQSTLNDSKQLNTAFNNDDDYGEFVFLDETMPTEIKKTVVPESQSNDSKLTHIDQSTKKGTTMRVSEFIKLPGTVNNPRSNQNKAAINTSPEVIESGNKFGFSA